MMIKVVVFDFGGVLIDWSFEYFYCELIFDDVECCWFFMYVCVMDWVVCQDGGQMIEEGMVEFVVKFFEYEVLICVFYVCWYEMIGGVFEEGVVFVDWLDVQGMLLFGLMNWFVQMFLYVWDNFLVLCWFKDIVVLGCVKFVKFDLVIYCEMYVWIELYLFGIVLYEFVFIDDNVKNVVVVMVFGWYGIYYMSVVVIEVWLCELGVLV